MARRFIVIGVREGNRGGVRQPGELGPDDPGDPGVPSWIHRVAFWVPVPENMREPVQSPVSAFPNVTADELAALSSGSVREMVVGEAGGQISSLLSQQDVAEALTGVWSSLCADLVSESEARKTSSSFGLMG